MRLYSFGNMYLLGIQAGIQCQHCTADLLVKYQCLQNVEPQKAIMAFEWAEEYKTTILLNGGMDKNLSDLVGFLDHKDNIYPWEFFRESAEALNNALTNVSIVLPENIYMYKKWVETPHTEIKDGGRTLEVFTEGDGDGVYSPGFLVYRYTRWEVELIERINDMRLMN